LNKKLAVYFLGTKIQDFFAALYKFGFLLIFYQFNNSLIYTSALTASSIVVARISMIGISPYLKKREPLIVTRYVNILLAVVAFVFVGTYKLWSGHVAGFFVLSIIFSSLEGIDNSFHYPIIPKLVEKDYLFKANSLNAIFTNINLIAAPIGTYFFYNATDLRGFLLLYGFICLLSSFILKYIYNIIQNDDYEETKKAKNNDGFKKEWKRTFKVIKSSKYIMFCILVGVIINLIFASLSGVVMLDMGRMAGNQILGQTIIKVMISIGSLLGVYFVYKLNVKDNYDRYINISLFVLLITLIMLSISSVDYLVYLEFLSLGVFIMFIMNSTGTFLQLVTPSDELAAVYVFRSTLYAVVVPLSHLLAGFILEYFGRSLFFAFSAILLGIVIIIKNAKKISLLNKEIVEEK